MKTLFAVLLFAIVRAALLAANEDIYYNVTRRRRFSAGRLMRSTSIDRVGGEREIPNIDVYCCDDRIPCTGD